MSRIAADNYISKADGPFAIGRTCAICGYGITARKPGPGRAGRGWGMREGNKLRGQMIQHINAEHRDVLDAARSK